MHLRLKKRFLRSLCDARWVYRELRETHDRTTARWPTAPWMLARAFAKRRTASVFSASSAILAKDAHRGRNGTSCPAMTPLRFTPIVFKRLHGKMGDFTA